MREEIEIKLALSRDEAERLIKAKDLKPIRKGQKSRRRLVSTYYDTPRHVLRKGGVALRVRSNGVDRVQTVKAPVAGPAGLQTYGEWESRLVGEHPDLAALDHADLPGALKSRDLEDRLSSVFVTDIERTALKVKSNGAKFEMAIDRGEIQSGRNGHERREPVCEVEFELISGDPISMLDVALDVCERYDVRLGHLTKAQRGYALAQPSLRPAPAKASRVRLVPEMSAGDAFTKIITATLEHLFANQVPTLEGHPKGVHQTRVAIRRLRAALRAFKWILPYDKRKAFNGEFRWFQQRLAPARDWHVFVDESLPLIERHGDAPDRTLKRLRRFARDERRIATVDSIANLETRRYVRLILQFERWLAGVATEIHPDLFDQPVKPFARSVLQKTRRDLLVETRAMSRLPAEDLHHLRKCGKKARYATEFFSSLWTGEEVKRYIKLMSRVQDRMGEANDAIVARHIMWNAKPGRQDPEAMDLIQSWSNERVRTRIRNANPHWLRLRKATPFWTLDDA